MSLQELYSVETGTSGPQVVFLPGLGGTTRYWQEHLETLPQSRRVLLVDLLGFGESPKPWTRYSVEQHVAALHHLLKERGRFTLVGHSMGSLLALAYAAHYPHQVERLVLFSVPYFGSKDKALSYFGSQSALYRRHRETPVPPPQMRDMTDRLRAFVEHADTIAPTDDVRRRAARLLASHPLRAADALQLAAALIWCEEQPHTETFVSLDERLCAAARKEGFDVSP